MINSLKVYVILFVFIFTGLLSLQAQQLHFNSLTVNDGLSQHDASSIIQDSYGFIWVGTYDGLNRYDGYNIKNYYSSFDDPNTLSSNRIVSLFEDSKKRIWIGTQGSGLNYYSLEEDKFYRVKTGERYSIINSIAENKSGDILVGTVNGILKVNESDKISTTLLQIPLTGVAINEIVVASDDTFYISANSGIWKLKDKVCEQIIEFDYPTNASLVLDKENRLWIGKGNTITVLNAANSNKKIAKINLPNSANLRSLSMSKNNLIWAGTFDDGLYAVDANKYKTIKHFKKDRFNKRTLLSNTILNIFCDKTNTLWLANRKGVCYVNLEEKKFNELEINKGTLANLKIGALCVNEDDVYFGIQSEGIFRFSKTNNNIDRVRLDGPDGNPLTMKLIDDVIYYGSSNGIYNKTSKDKYFKKKQFVGNEISLNNLAIYSICKDSFGKTYYGSSRGLLVEDKNRLKWIFDIKPQTELLRGKRVFSLFYDSQENCLWIGTISDGLFKMNFTEDGEFFSLQIYSSAMQNEYFLSNNTVWCFFKDLKDNLWLGSDSGLFLKAKSSNKFKLISTKELKGKKIMGIQEDNSGNLWLNNSLGLFTYNPKTKKTLKYTYKDGLSSNTLTEAIGKHRDGTIFTGTIDGINYFKPSEIIENPYKSDIIITDFRVHGESVIANKENLGSNILEKSINAVSEIELNYRQNNFLFEFSSTNYASPEESRFKYKLEGYDKDWIYVSSDHRFATYSNLNKGNYTFWVESANQDGIWSGNPKKIQVSLSSAPWLSAYAYLGYAIILLAIIGAFIYFWNNRQQLNHQIELDKIEIKKEQEINEFKLAFFTDIAHEFKTPLSLIIGPLNDLMQNKHTKESIDFCYQVLSRNTQRLMHLVNQLLDFRKVNANMNILRISKNDLSTFVSNLSKSFLWQAENEKIHFNVVVPESFTCYFDSDLIGKVLYNLLSNAFKYTPKNGFIEMHLKQIWNGSSQVAVISIKDNGKGISNEDKEKIFDRYFHGLERTSSGIGLHLSQKLINAHKGTINVADSSFGGTEFIISFPVSKTNYNEIEFSKLEVIKNEIENQKQIKFNEIDEINDNLERILIVEDDHDLRSYLKNSLQKDFKILEATNGLEGLNLAKEEIPDVIISDVMMPVMDGVEMCKTLRNDKSTSHIPFLMLTAKTDSEFKKIGLKVGAWDYIAKPFNTRNLLQKVKNIIETRNHFKNFLLNQNITTEVEQHYKPFDQKLILKVKSIIKERMQNPDFSVEELASSVGLSRMQLHRKLKSLVGHSTTKFINTIKMETAKMMFDEGHDRIQEVMDAVGFSSYSHFNSVFKEVIGKTPSNYIKFVSV